MIISRGLNLVRTVYARKQPAIAARNLQFARLSHNFTYRKLGSEDKFWELMAELFGGFVWWWLLWHFWHDFGHLVGEFPYPDASKWTDEELGIPPDDADE